MSKVIVEIGSAAILAAVLEKVCLSFNRQDLAEWIRVAGISIIGVTAVTSVFKLIDLLQKRI